PREPDAWQRTTVTLGEGAEPHGPESGRLCHAPRASIRRRGPGTWAWHVGLARGAAARPALVFRLCIQRAEMPRHAAPPASEPLHVSLVAIPEAAVSTLTGVFDVMNAFSMLSQLGDASFDRPPFRVEIAGLRPGPLELASRVPV